jgi:ribosomal protein L20A (L18A)
MKRFKVEGWYRYNDEKDFTSLTFEAIDIKKAMVLFLDVYYRKIKFYKIDIKEIV